MKNSDFWFLTLCTLLIIAGVNGWSIPLRVATASNASVVLMDAVKKIKALKKG